MLADCLAGSRLREISAQACWHANGFAKFALTPGRPGAPLRLRLHVWLADEAGNQPGGDQNVHGHRWNFGSVVIAGSGLHVDEYVRDTGHGELYNAYGYRPDTAAGPAATRLKARVGADINTKLEPVGTALLEHAVSYDIGLHGTYACDVDTLHTVRPATGPLTATLVMQGPAVLAAAPVFRRPDQGVQAAPRPMTPSQARAVLAAVIETASTPGGA